MKIEVNLNKKFLVFSLLIGLILIGFVGVYAYNSIPANPAVFGHSIDEMDWSKMIKANVSINGRMGIGTSNPGTNLDVNGSMLVNSALIGFHEQGLTGAPSISITGNEIKAFGTATYQNLYLSSSGIGGGNVILQKDEGNVGIGTLTPVEKLEVNGNISTTNYLKSAGVCIGTDCRTTWPAGGGGSVGTLFINYTTCHWVGAVRCGACVKEWLCPNGEIATGSGQGSSGETHLDWIKVRCCKISIV